MSLIRLVSAAFIAFWMTGCVGLYSQERTMDVTVTEHLNRAWHHELLSYDIDLPKLPEGAVAVAAVTRLDGTAVPAQVADGKVWFIVPELAPLSSQSFHLSVRPGKAEAVAPPADGKLTTPAFGIQVLTGSQTYAEPKAAADVPGPIQGWRRPDGSWGGGSRLYGDQPIAGYEASILAVGPVFAHARVVYTYADGNTLSVDLRLPANDDTVLIDTLVGADAPESGWELVLGPAAGFTDGTAIFGQRYLAKEIKAAIPSDAATPMIYLTPWHGDGWFRDATGSLAIPLSGQAGAVQLAVVHPGDWVVPQERPTWAHFDRWDFPTIGEMWQGWTNKRLPVVRQGDQLALRHDLRQGVRRFSLGLAPDTTRLLKRAVCEEMSVYGPLPRLNEVKEMVLAWPDGEERHPYLYLDAAELTEAMAAKGLPLAKVVDPKGLKTMLDKLGTVDLMRNVMDIAGKYDLVIDSVGMTPEERALIRAQTAYVAYETASPWHWDIRRGWTSGNPNMTVSRLANLGVIASALRDHPMAAEWNRYVSDWFVWWLENVTDPTGDWPESSHYARVSWADYTEYAIAARRAGVYDFYRHPRFLAMARFYEETMTPPDPMRRRDGQPVRVGAPYGRGTRGDAWGLSGLLAAATAKSDPAFSAEMQWCYQQSGYSPMVSHPVGMLETLYPRRDLPATAPDWRSRYFPSVGWLLRHRFATPAEDYLLFVTERYQCPDGQIWPPDTGAIAKWFANGTPIGGSFRRVPEVTTTATVNRVMLADNWDPASGTHPPNGYVSRPAHLGSAILPTAQYADVRFDTPEIVSHHLGYPKDLPPLPKRAKVGQAPFTWRRQVLLVAPSEADGHSYLVLRDTVAGGQPTAWHFWLLSQKLGTPQQAADRDAFLADAPGVKNLPPTMLSGDRFTAIGQFDRDIEAFVASPAGTPRYTMRYGTAGGAYGIGGSFKENQDLLGIQLEGDGVYYVVLYPRLATEAAPTFSVDGDTITVVHADGTDVITLGGDAAGDTTTASLVQQRGETTTISLFVAGTATGAGATVTAPGPAAAQVGPQGITVTPGEGVDRNQVKIAR